MKTGALITSATGGIGFVGAVRCGVLALGVAVSGMAATSETTSFSPLFVKDGAGKFRTLTWTYVINGGQPLTIEDDEAGELTFRYSDLKLTVNPTAKTRQGYFSVAISGDAKGSATAKFTESLEPLEDRVRVESQQVNIGMKLSADGLSASVLISLLTQFSPSPEWFLDRSDLDQLGVGFAWAEEAWGAVTGSVKVSIPGYGSDSQEIDEYGSVPDYWEIVDVLERFQVGGVTYRNVVVVDRLTQVPTGQMDGSSEEAVVTYWVAQGVGMIKGVGQYQFMGQPLDIELKSATLELPDPAALPAWAQGTFDGYVEGGGLATMKVTSQGKITGKITLNGSNFTFSAASYASGGDEEQGYALGAEAKAGKVVLPVELYVMPAGEALAQGVAVGQLGGLQVTLWQNVWKNAGDALAPLMGYYTATLPGDGSCGSGYLTFTVDKAAKVKVGGRLADGTAVSQSGALVRDVDGRVFAVVYLAPKAYLGGCLFGLAEFAETWDGLVCLRPLDGQPFVWQNRSPQATAEYGEGFWREPSLTGGWYDKVGNLGEYYQGRTLSVETSAFMPELTVKAERYASVWWSPAGLVLTPTLRSGVMTGLAAPKAGAPTDADKDRVWDYETAENTVGLKVTLVRATGLFKGSFKAWFDYGTTHTSKILSYEGVLTPVREDGLDGVEGRGFYLWPDKGSYENAAGKTVTYAFKWSYDFLLLGE